MMLSEVVRKHLLKERKTPLNDDDLEIAIYVGWNARNEEIERLKSENARYREALEVIASRQDEWSLEATLRSFVFELQKRTEIAQRALKGTT